jgi:hypothetical protein
MQASYVFRQVPGDCLDLHYLSFIAFSCPNLLQEVDRFDDLDVLLKNRGFRGVHKVYIRVKSFITLYAMVPFSYI